MLLWGPSVTPPPRQLMAWPPAALWLADSNELVCVCASCTFKRCSAASFADSEHVCVCCGFGCCVAGYQIRLVSRCDVGASPYLATPTQPSEVDLAPPLAFFWIYSQPANRQQWIAVFIVRLWHLEVNESYSDNPQLTARVTAANLYLPALRPPKAIYSGHSHRQPIRFQGLPSHSAIHSSLHIEVNWALLHSLYPSFFLLCLFLKSIEAIFPPRPQRRARNDRGPSRAHTNTFHLLQVNNNWLLTFTYPQIGLIALICCPAPARNADYSACVAPPRRQKEGKSLCHWIHHSELIEVVCVPLFALRRGETLVPEWCFGRVLSISRPPVGVIIAAWNCWCWKVIRYHMVSLSPTTPASQISHLSTKKRKSRDARTDIPVKPRWHRFGRDFLFNGFHDVFNPVIRRLN